MPGRISARRLTNYDANSTPPVTSLDQLRFASVQIPSLVQYGTNFWLACSAELANQEQLYSVKWYRANEEFYRVISDGHQATAQHQGEAPSSKQQQQYFGQAGVSVRVSLLSLVAA